LTASRVAKAGFCIDMEIVLTNQGWSYLKMVATWKKFLSGPNTSMKRKRYLCICQQF
jgi:hypothetical protein